MILFFDTETTGLPKNWKASVNDNDDLFETMLFVVDKIEEDWGHSK